MLLSRTHRHAVLASVVLVAIGAAVLGLVQPQRGQGGGDVGQLLVAGLRETPGCLGVDSARMQSGKSAIFAWFENAEAARRWYRHPTHVRMLRMTGTNPEQRTPLEHVPEGVPLMVIASLTMTDQPKIQGIPLPIEQISIELYAPLPGGAMVNGRLAPDAFKVEHMRSLSADGPYGADGEAVPSR
ncbi:MAG: hypothetical protein AAGK04_04460 [Planctomycetota bacterium]